MDTDGGGSSSSSKEDGGDGDVQVPGWKRGTAGTGTGTGAGAGAGAGVGAGVGAGATGRTIGPGTVVNLKGARPVGFAGR